MSARLQRLKAFLDRQTQLITPDERLAWLHGRISKHDRLCESADWAKTLNALAHNQADKLEIDVVEAWFYVVETLASSIPDPKDQLYGVILSVYAWKMGIHYKDPDRFAELLRLFAAAYEKEEKSGSSEAEKAARRTFKYVLERLIDLQMALQLPLENPIEIDPETLIEPAVIVAGIHLLHDVVQSRQKEARERGVELDLNEIVQYAEYSGHYLWASYQAFRCRMDMEEVTAFVISFDGWFAIMEELVRLEVLETGILFSMCTCEGTDEQLAEEGPGLVVIWRKELTRILPLNTYLTQVMRAVATD